MQTHRGPARTSGAGRQRQHLRGASAAQVGVAIARGIFKWSVAALCGWMLTGCDKISVPGLGSPSAAEVRREAEGRAIGGACRHAGRAIEDCFALNRQADKSAIFAGWREMNDYMAEKNVAPVPSVDATASSGNAGTTPTVNGR